VEDFFTIQYGDKVVDGVAAGEVLGPPTGNDWEVRGDGAVIGESVCI